MALALELGLDPDAEGAVRALWDVLERSSVPSMATHAPAIRPHVTLAVTDDGSGLRGAAGVLQSRLLPVAAELVGPAFFPTEPPILHLAVTPTRELLEMHRSVLQALDDAGVDAWPHYCVDAWVPHCTLSMGVPHERLGDALAAALRAPFPMRTTLGDPRLTDSETGGTTPL